MRFSKKAQYGLRAMVYLAKFFPQKKVVSLKTISEKEDIPFNFLEKIILEMKKAGLVKAKKGVQGGYIIAHNPQKITIGDVVRTLDKTSVFLFCRECKRTRNCLTRNVWKKVQNSLNTILNSITLKSLIK